MAGAFLAKHGIDLDAELSRIQFGSENDQNNDNNGNTSIYRIQNKKHTRPLQSIHNARIPGHPPDTRWTITLDQEHITNITPSSTCSPPPINTLHANGRLLAPSLCHPHVHLDKAYLLSHPKFAHLQIQRGDFDEAMALTSQAKALFNTADLLDRGRRVLDESVRAGVTHMRAFYEVDAGVALRSLEAGLQLKREQRARCEVQIVAFAQLPLFSGSGGDPEGKVIRSLMTDAARRAEVEVVGSTPYVEGDRTKMEQNVDWLIDLAIEYDTHVDFHLDYNLDAASVPLVWYVLRRLREKDYVGRTGPGRTIVFGHCSRLTLFSEEEWAELAKELHSSKLPVSFVGLPTSDLFMMRSDGDRRGTLNVPRLIRDYGLNACLGINNIGNAFTPHGSCDPLTLACYGSGVYQASTSADAKVLYEAISTRARSAIGIRNDFDNNNNNNDDDDDDDDNNNNNNFATTLQSHDPANLLLFGADDEDWRTRKSIPEAVQLYDHCQGRTSIFKGTIVSDGDG